jgi:thiol-disulfide isomerase/thioredoxin
METYWLFVTGFIFLYLFFLFHVQNDKHILPGQSRHLLTEFFTDSQPVFTMVGVDWCPHCVTAKPEFLRLGPTLTIGDHVIQTRVVNPEQDPTAAKDLPVEGYPSFFLQKGDQILKYQGPRTTQGFQSFVAQQFSP